MPADSTQFFGQKRFFRITAGSGAPVQVKPDVPCIGVVMFNEGPSPLRIGNPSGTIASLGLFLPSGVMFQDEYSDDAWWAQSSTSSGTISGYYIEP